MELEIFGESFELLGNKMLWWPRRRTLLIADTHFGKAATFREAGIPVPEGGCAKMLSMISSACRDRAAQRLLFLGDFVHSTPRRQLDYVDQLREWRKEVANIQLVLVRGNHDRGHEALFDELELEIVETRMQEDLFLFGHYPEPMPEEGNFLFAGHVHPAVRIPLAPKRETKIPCFHFRNRTLVLPAFGVFTGTKVVVPEENDRFFGVVDGDVIEVRGL